MSKTSSQHKHVSYNGWYSLNAIDIIRAVHSSCSGFVFARRKQSFAAQNKKETVSLRPLLVDGLKKETTARKVILPCVYL